jgi:hypothetical protein
MPPLDLTDVHRRRLFAQEFTTRLQTLGSASLQQMECEFGLVLFKIPASGEELRQVADVARRLGWVQAPEGGVDGEWSLTDSGRSLARPTSLATVQVAARIARTANPIREQAGSWLPILALVAGGLAASDVTTLTAVRILAIALLAWTFAIQAIGEARIVACVKHWPKLDDDAEKQAHKAVLRFYGWSRLALNLAALAAAVTAFGLGIFNQQSQFWIALVVTGGLGAPALLLSAMAAREVHRHRPPPASSRRPPSSAVG